MKYITINLRDEDASPPYDKTAGANGESFVKGVEFILPEEYSNWSVFVDILNPKGEKYRQEILIAVDGVIKYDFTNVDLCERGRLFLDLILVNGQQIAKPFRGEFAVKHAICAEDDPDAEPVTLVTSQITESLQQLMELYPILSNLGENEDEILTYKNNAYITTDSLAEAVGSLISASVEDDTLILTYQGGNP